MDADGTGVLLVEDDRFGGTGFRGRLGVFELFEVDDQVRAFVMERRDASTMFQDGLGKAILGETTMDEVVRAAL
jgi:type II secretory ATPase GspE/PulE/Tfp pilus assembly ATPase PilB-like protein